MQRLPREPPLLSVEDLVTEFERAPGEGGAALRAVDGVSFEIMAGRTVGLVGESGCGKSVTALSILGLLGRRASNPSGAVRYRGVDLLKVAPKQLRSVRGAQIAMIFQEPMTSLNPVYTVGDQVGEPLRIHRGMSRRKAHREAVELLKLVGIADPERRADEYPHQMSGGMRQRVMIAMALACRPDLLIADEPTTALDVTIQAQILELLARLQRELGMAVLLITHDLGVVAESCDEVVVMYAGQVVEQAKVAELFAHPRHPYTAGLLRAMPRAIREDDNPVVNDRDNLVVTHHDNPVVTHNDNFVVNDPLPVAARRTQRLAEIPGMVPQLDALPYGCRFQDRCDRVREICRATPPTLELLSPSHLARCHVPVEVNA